MRRFVQWGRLGALCDAEVTPQDGQVPIWSATEGEWTVGNAGTGIPGPPGPEGPMGPAGPAGASIAIFDQATEPTTAVAGDIWIVP